MNEQERYILALARLRFMSLLAARKRDREFVQKFLRDLMRSRFIKTLKAREKELRNFNLMQGLWSLCNEFQVDDEGNLKWINDMADALRGLPEFKGHGAN